jgi:hypothetical protein
MVGQRVNRLAVLDLLTALHARALVWWISNWERGLVRTDKQPEDYNTRNSHSIAQAS